MGRSDHRSRADGGPVVETLPGEEEGDSSVKSLTLEISKAESGYVATVSRGGKFNLLPFGKKTFAGDDFDKLMADVTARIREVLMK